MINIVDILTHMSGASFLSLDSITNVTLRGGKKNPFQNRVQKYVTRSNVMVFQNKLVNGYDAMVRRRLQRENKDPDSFKLGQRVWGSRIEGLPLVEHLGKHYLEVIYLRTGKVEYLVDGYVTDKDKIEGIPDTVMNEESQGGLSDKVILRVYALSSITSINADRQTFTGPFHFSS